MKTAVVFVENQVINVVLGKLLKQVKVSDLPLDHNVEFFETLFSEHRVVIVDQVSPITKDAFYSSFDQASATERLMAAEAGDDDVEAPIIESRSSVKTLPKSTVAKTATKVEARENYSYGIWLKSNAKAIIIIDDIYTDQALKNVPGAKMSLCIHPDRAIDISTLDKEQVKRSQILRKLLGNGTLSECSSAEAQQIEDRYWAAEDKKRGLEDKALDKMILPAGVSAADFASGVRADDEVINIDLTNEREDKGEPATDYDDLLKTMRKNREEPAPVEPQMSLAQQIAMAEEDAALNRRTNIVARERQVDPTKPQARGFRRTHGAGGDDE